MVLVTRRNQFRKIYVRGGKGSAVQDLKGGSLFSIGLKAVKALAKNKLLRKILMKAGVAVGEKVLEKGTALLVNKFSKSPDKKVNQQVIIKQILDRSMKTLSQNDKKSMKHPAVKNIIQKIKANPNIQKKVINQLINKQSPSSILSNLIYGSGLQII